MLDTDALIKHLQHIKKNDNLKKVFLGTSLDGISETHDKVRNYKNAFKKQNTIKNYVLSFRCFTSKQFGRI